MSSNRAAAAGRLAICALLSASSAGAAPATAGQTAVLTVRVQVIDACRITLPDAVPPQVSARLNDHLGHLVEHRCAGPGPRPKVAAGPFLRPLPTASQARGHPGGVLVTISY